MGLDRKPQRLAAVRDICERLAAPDVIDRLGTAGVSYVLDAALDTVRGGDPEYAYGAALEALGDEVSATEAERMIREIFGGGS